MFKVNNRNTSRTSQRLGINHIQDLYEEKLEKKKKIVGFAHTYYTNL